jgi:16S rRNA (guanine527-N7)-methyltransferase
LLDQIAGLDAAVVSRETVERLEIFVALLRTWNKKIGLVSRSDDACIWARHVADSLQIAGHIPDNADMAIDCGSGAGFPGLVTSIVSGRHVHLVESDRRKASFLREAGRATNANVTVHAIRCEDVVLAKAGVITARALAPLKILLPLVEHLVDDRTTLLLLKGREFDRELAAVAGRWIMNVVKFPAHSGSDRCVVSISGLQRAR